MAAAAPFRIVRAGAPSGVATYTHESGLGGPSEVHARITDDALEDDSSTDQVVLTAMPGQAVASIPPYMRGHGTYVDVVNEELVASLSGTIERVNKLISVHPARTRYRPEVGDLVIGRITEVQSRRWKVDIGSKADASLQLSSINLPGGVQRKKLESDELQMRAFFQEGDLVVAEVQSLFQDGSVGLHARSLRYGKLRNGTLVVVPPVLVRRHKSHFCSLMDLPADGIDLVLGLNGLVWVSKHVPFDVAKAEGEGEGTEFVGPAGRGIAMDVDGVYSDVNEPIPPATRASIALVCFVFAAFAHYGLPITEPALQRACAVAQTLDAPDAVARAAQLVEAL